MQSSVIYLTIDLVYIKFFHYFEESQIKIGLLKLLNDIIAPLSLLSTLTVILHNNGKT